MKLLTTLPQGDLNAVPDAVAAAERAGFDAVITQENRNDPFLSLAVAAVSSQRIGLATGVAIAFPRSPMVVANAAWDLQNASGGRFVLGLGPQIRPHNEKRFSVPFYDNGIDDSLWVVEPGEGLVPRTKQGVPDPDGLGDYKTALFDVTQGSQLVQWGALGSIGVETDRHQVGLTYIYLSLIHI